MRWVEGHSHGSRVLRRCLVFLPTLLLYLSRFLRASQRNRAHSKLLYFFKSVSCVVPSQITAPWLVWFSYHVILWATVRWYFTDHFTFRSCFKTEKNCKQKYGIRPDELFQFVNYSKMHSKVYITKNTNSAHRLVVDNLTGMARNFSPTLSNHKHDSYTTLLRLVLLAKDSKSESLERF